MRPMSMTAQKEIYKAYEVTISATRDFLLEMGEDISSALMRYNELTNDPKTLHSRERRDAETACFDILQKFGLDIPEMCDWHERMTMKFGSIRKVVGTLDSDLAFLREKGTVNDTMRNVMLDPTLKKARRLGGERLERVWKSSLLIE